MSRFRICRRMIERSMLRLRSSRVIPSRESCSWNWASFSILFSFLIPSIMSLMYSGRRCRPASSARCTSRMSSTASWRIFALFSRRNWATLSGSTRAAWAAASCRDWNSVWVMTSPLTLAMMRSRISAPAGAAPRRRRLGRRTCRRSMIHLRPGQEIVHELADVPVRFLTGQQGPDSALHFRKAGGARFLPGLHPKDMIPEAGGHDLAGAARGQGEGDGLQLGRQLAAREGAHEATVSRLRSLGVLPGDVLEVLGRPQELPERVPRLVLGGHQDLADGDGLRDGHLRRVGPVVGGHLPVADRGRRDRLGEKLAHRALLALAPPVLGQEAPFAGLDHERPLLEKGFQQAAADFGRQGGATPGLHLGDVALEVATPHDALVQLEDDGVSPAIAAAGHRGQRDQERGKELGCRHRYRGRDPGL